MSNLLKKVTYLFIFSILFFSSCQKEQLEPGVENSPQLENKLLKSPLPDLYVKGEDIPEIIASVDQSLKGGELEERNGNQLPFKLLGYDKSRALKVYNDSFEITSYSFMAYTDNKDLNKLTNVVVTQKKNGKPGKPYLYEYTTQNVSYLMTPHISKIIKYKLNGVQVDISGSNFNPCIDVICNQYNIPIGGGGTSGSGGSSGGGTGSLGSTSSPSGYGDFGNWTSGTTPPQNCTYSSFHAVAVDGGTLYYRYYDCGVVIIDFRPGTQINGCCDPENVSIGIFGISFNQIVDLLISSAPQASNSMVSPDFPIVQNMRMAINELRNRGVDPVWCNLMDQLLTQDLNQLTMGELRDIYDLVVTKVSEYNIRAWNNRNQIMAQYMIAIFSPENVGQILGWVTLPSIQRSAPSHLLHKRLLQYSAKKASELCSDLSKGFDTFNQFKSAYGPAGTGKAWHHLVEQNTADSGLFVAKKVHHPDNLIPIKTEFNTFLNGLYSRNGQFPELGGLSLRNWLKTQPFEKHMEWGLKVYNENKHLFL